MLNSSGCSKLFLCSCVLMFLPVKPVDENDLGFASEKLICDVPWHPWSTAPACHFGDSLMMCVCVVPHAHSVAWC